MWLGGNFSTWSLSVMLHKSHLGFIYSQNVPVQIALVVLSVAAVVGALANKFI